MSSTVAGVGPGRWWGMKWTIAALDLVASLALARRATAEEFGPETIWYTSVTACQGTPCWVADVNGDGLADIIAHEHKGWFDADFNVALGTTQGVDPPVAWLNFFLGEWTGFGDVDGDGKADMVVYFEQTGIAVCPSTGWSFDVNAADVWSEEEPPGPMFLADANGDGLADLVAFDQDSPGTVLVYLSTGSGLTNGDGFDGPYVWHSSFAPAGHVPLVADLDGDGKADIVSIDGSNVVRVALSTGSSFGTASTWHSNWPGAVSVRGSATSMVTARPIWWCSRSLGRPRDR